MVPDDDVSDGTRFEEMGVRAADADRGDLDEDPARTRGGDRATLELYALRPGEHADVHGGRNGHGWHLSVVRAFSL